MLSDLSQEDIRDNAALMTTTTTLCMQGLKVLATQMKYQQMSIEAKQHDIGDNIIMVMFHSNWC